MTDKVLEFIGVSPQGIYLDCTFGEGGHTERLLEQGAAKVVAFDRDRSAIEIYREQGKYRKDARLRLIHGSFRDLEGRFDGAIADLGVSTRQLLEPARGFSFSSEGPLDMRMDPSCGDTLLDRLSRVSEKELSQILWRYGQVASPHKVARRILERVRQGKVSNTIELASLSGKRSGKTHPATNTFLALRIWVNQELEEIEQGLPMVIDHLSPKARLAVITFHSVEDGLVKRLFKRLAGQCVCEGLLCQCSKIQRVRIVPKKPVLPSCNEMDKNPRARSAKLRCVEKIDHQG